MESPKAPVEQSPVRHLLESKGQLTKDVVAAKTATGTVLDLHSDAPSDSDLTPIRIDAEAALRVIRHSTAHVMADAVQKLYPGTKVAFGPATDAGFYYDYDRPAGPFTDDELRAIEVRMAEIISQDLPFRRETVSAAEARVILEKLGETYKLEHLARLEAQGESISLYRHGDWVDLCEGPHVPSTRFLSAFKLTSAAGAYWRGDERNPMLQRIYGTAFANQKGLDAHLKQLEQAKERDHRKLGKELDLISFHHWSPASPFFLPRGAAVYNGLITYVRNLYLRYGYQEVVTPQVFDRQLFETSGHLPTYAENMFLAVTRENLEELCDANAGKAPLSAQALLDGVRFGIKPMNCPGHALLFSLERRSYRQLPYRMADFGRLHRFERSGVTQGLTRVRTFCQDDAHIFCELGHMQREIESFIDLVYEVYQDFGFTEVKVAIATRPEKRLGSDEMWTRAEQALVDGVKVKGIPYESAEGEGAFYGPKIEFHLKDAIGRSWQLGTMQVDFNLPEFFKLEYIGEDNSVHRPVMLHRAILGSIERFFGVYLEHVAGAFPTWLAPEQIALLTVSERFTDYAESVRKELVAVGIRVELDVSNEKLGAKIRRARNMRIPFRAVIGEKEVEARTLSLTVRDGNQELGALPIADVISRIHADAIPMSQRPKSV